MLTLIISTKLLVVGVLSAIVTSKFRIKNTYVCPRQFFSIPANSGNNNFAEKYTKSNLPSKICAVCGRPFEWRKKWQKV